MNIKSQIERLIDLAIQEDLGTGDVISNACIPEGLHALGTISLKQNAVVAGLSCLEHLFHKIDPQLKLLDQIEESSQHKAGTVITEVSGPVRALLACERVALNLLQCASGVGTATAGYVRKVAGYDCAIVATRTTLPDLRPLAQYAFEVGGGKRHRGSLDERIIIKRNHLAFLATSEKPISEAFQRARQRHPKAEIELEIRHYKELAEALQLDLESIMLDNMTPDEVSKCVQKIHAAKKKAWVQSFTEITLDTIRDYAKTGADGICIGAVTHSISNIQISFKLKEI